MIPVSNYIHYDFKGDNNNVVQVFLNEWANVLLLDDVNYNKYINGETYKYYGGKAEVSPFNIRPPHCSHWHVVIDRGGYGGHVKASVKII